MTAVAAAVGAVGVLLTLLAPSRWMLVGGLALLGAALAGLAPELSTGGLPRVSAPLVLAALAGVAGVAAAFVRFPAAVVPSLLLAAPLQVPLRRTGETVFLWLPLYAVLAAATAALVWSVLRSDAFRPLSRAVAIPAAALMAIASLSLLWSRDPAAGTVQLAFFWLPFAALVAVVAQAPLTPRTGRLLAMALVAEAAVFAVIGIAQALAGRLLIAGESLDLANELGPFRVNAVFTDPNVYGRFLVLGIAVVLVALWVSRLPIPAGLALVALLGAGLYVSYSQSSMVALVCVALALTLVAGGAWGRRLAVGVGATLLVAGVVVLAVALRAGSAESFTSDRSTLVSGTAATFAAHPLIGVGVAAQPRVTRREVTPGASIGESTSHTAPLTVAAELGVLGLAAYLALLAAAARALVAAHHLEPALALGLTAVLLALVVHSLFYPGFFQNPIVWGSIAMAAAGAGRRPPAPLRS